VVSVRGVLRGDFGADSVLVLGPWSEFDQFVLFSMLLSASLGIPACVCMYVCVCVYVSMYVYIYIYIYTYIHAHVGVRIRPVGFVFDAVEHELGYTCIYACMYVC
jgi:hypothetical protein